MLSTIRIPSTQTGKNWLAIPVAVIAETLGITKTMVQKALDAGCTTYEEIREFCEINNLQYIISVIKSDVPNNFKFSDEEIITTLTHEKPLFGFNF